MYTDQPEQDAKQDDGAGLLRQMGMMLRALRASPVRNTLFVLGGAIFLVIVGHGLWPDPAQPLEPAFLRCPGAPRF